eukprot:CAMPEP_0117498958 /NCGR_PEP_ID=MMETSP0784-20121206/21988_1 /TAXON_ID=39447 /ORGANISM="" /LENGTH=327 /DNA_ID=CAMNT_0005294071 /DNA_START=42 /DNA_END=1025 /DNA_ORIENTATION=-
MCDQTFLAFTLLGSLWTTFSERPARLAAISRAKIKNPEQRPLDKDSSDDGSNHTLQLDKFHDIQGLVDDAGLRTAEGDEPEEISGSLYKLWAVGLQEDERLMVRLGCVAIMLVQLVTPIQMLLWSTLQLDWSGLTVGLSHWRALMDLRNPENLIYLLQHILALLFLLLFILNAFVVVETEARTWLKLRAFIHLLPPRFMENGSFFWLTMGPIVLAHVVVGNCVNVLLLGFVYNAPTDVVLNAFGLFFLYELDLVDSELGILDGMGWEARSVGVLYTELTQASGHDPDDMQQWQHLQHPIFSITYCTLLVFAVALPIVFIFVQVPNKD